MMKQNQLRDSRNDGTRSNIIKFKPLLAKKRINLLEYPTNVVKYIIAVKFVCADMHDNLKMMFNEPVNRKFMHAFKLKMELAEMIAKTDHEDPSDMHSYDES